MWIGIVNSIATFAILSCSSNDDMPRVSERFTYCLLYYPKSGYVCEYVSVDECDKLNGNDYSDALTCKSRLQLYSSSSQSQNSYAYCLYYSNGYRCEYMSVSECNGIGTVYTNNTCGGNLQPSSSSRPSSSSYYSSSSSRPSSSSFSEASLPNELTCPSGSPAVSGAV